jgi:Glycosyl hydrolase catalytic core
LGRLRIRYFSHSILAGSLGLRHIRGVRIRIRFVLKIAVSAAGMWAAAGGSIAQETAKLDPKTVARRIELEGSRHVKVDVAQFAQGAFNFNSPDAWLFIEGVPPSKVLDGQMKRLFVTYEPAVDGGNVRVVAHGDGSVVIPHGPKFPALTLFSGKSLSGAPVVVRAHEKPVAGVLGEVRSFRLRRGYMATLAEKADGTGISRNYVAQDQDIEVRSLPYGLDAGVSFVRVFPWRWTGKKGIAGNIWQKLDVDWYYDWNIGGRTTPDIEYVPIRQNRYWPGLNQDWKQKGSVHLLGFNEPDRPDQANMKVDEAIQAWPELLKTGLRLGSPAVSDGGLKWLYEFMEKADEKKFRVDFIAVHYYRAVGDPGDGRAAAAQMKAFLDDIHKRTGRPIWITEWNNGANWTKARDPNEKEQGKAIQAMIDMLDETDYVERYSLYNWVEDSRMLQRKDGSLTPAGEAYREQRAPIAYRQEKP